MDNNFTVLLKQFIDCYIADPLAVEVHLLNAQQDIDSDVFGERYEGEADARDLSLKNAYRALEERLFAEPSSTDVAGRNPRMSSGEEPKAPDAESSQKKWKEWKEQRFQAFLNKLAWSLEMPRDSLDGWIAEEGLTRGQLAEVERDPAWRKKEAEYDFGVDSEPNMQVVLAKEFADWLDVAVAKIERVEEASYRSSIPMHLRQYLHQAYRCDLYGLGAASVALCGAILQEAIRFRMGAEGLCWAGRRHQGSRAVWPFDAQGRQGSRGGSEIAQPRGAWQAGIRRVGRRSENVISANHTQDSGYVVRKRGLRSNILDESDLIDVYT